MKLNLLACTTAIALLAGISQASADIITVTWTGTVNSGSDVNGYFGASGTNLAGQNFTATYVFDSATPGSFASLGSGGTQSLLGGNNYNNSNPMVTTTYAPTTPLTSATLSINGQTISVGTGQGDYATLAAGNGLSGSFAYSSYLQTRTFNVISGLAQSDWMQLGFVGNTTGLIAGFPINIDQDGSYTLGAGVRVDTTDSTFVRNGEALNFSPLSVAIDVTSSVAAVPEASTWAMMLLGFGGLGFMSYRRSQRKGGLSFRLV